MATHKFTESVVEQAALVWLEGLGYAVLHGPDIAPGMLGAERGDSNYRDVVLERNRTVHRILVDGITVEYRRPDGSIAGAQG